MITAHSTLIQHMTQRVAAGFETRHADSAYDSKDSKLEWYRSPIENNGPMLFGQG